MVNPVDFQLFHLESCFQPSRSNAMRLIVTDPAAAGHQLGQEFLEHVKRGGKPSIDLTDHPANCFHSGVLGPFIKTILASPEQLPPVEWVIKYRYQWDNIVWVRSAVDPANPNRVTL